LSNVVKYLKESKKKTTRAKPHYKNIISANTYCYLNRDNCAMSFHPAR